jgi:hypothetical protein
VEPQSARRMGSQMAPIARLLARRVPASHAEADVLKQLALFCCADLLVSLLLMTYGVDLSPGPQTHSAAMRFT